MKKLIQLFKYIEPIWLGVDNKLSIRRTLALVFSLDLIRNTHYSIFQWGEGKSYSEAAMLLGIEAALIAAFLSLTTYSSMINSKNKGSINLGDNTEING